MTKAHNKVPAAFLSYTRFDDEHNQGMLTEFRKYLSAEVRSQTGEEFQIFQDREHIEWGQKWEERINEAISGVTFLIPIITPSFFKSQACRTEVEKFLKREQVLNRTDLILPLYFIDTPLINNATKRTSDPMAEAIASHQFADWRNLRFEAFTSPVVRKELEKLAIQIRDALERPESSNSLTIVQDDTDSLSSGIQPPKEDKGIIEAQEAAQDVSQLLVQIITEMNSSSTRVNEQISRINGSSQDAKTASIIAVDMNSTTQKIERLLQGVEEHVDTVVNFFSGYIPELNPKLPEDRSRLHSFREQFTGLSAPLTIALERIQSNRGSSSKLAISADTIRAGRRRAEVLNKLISSMEQFQDFFERAVRTIDEKLNEK